MSPAEGVMLSVPSRLVFFVTEDWYFCSHRLALAVAAQNAGYEVSVVTRVRAHGDAIRSAGLHLVPFEMKRRGKNPFRELAHIWRLTRIYKSLRPDIVHHVAMKPVLYGTIAAGFARVPHVVNALAGLGFVFSSRGLYARLLRPVIRAMLSRVMRCGAVIVQNPDDAVIVCSLGISTQSLRMVRGSGVDIRRFVPAPEADGQPMVMLASRMLWSKGVGEFVEAAKHIRRARPEVRFILVGDTDEDNPAAVPRDQLAAWRDGGIVEWWGRRREMEKVLAEAHVVCLPTTYGEGVPKILIEAAACGRPMVATDVPGCREIVRDSETGLLVPPGDTDALVDALARLLDDAALRRRMGRRAREIVENEFSIEKVVDETLSVYRDLS